MISTFLKSSSHNLKYVGIDGLARIVRINPKYAAEHQLAVIDCLEDPDDMLYKMTKPNNVEVRAMQNHCSLWAASSGKLVALHHTSPIPMALFCQHPVNANHPLLATCTFDS